MKIRRIILQAGHGGLKGEQYDPGAVGPKGETEHREVVQIINRLVPKLQALGLVVIISPDSRLAGAIKWVNQNCDEVTDLAIEIHKDSTAKMTDKLRRRMGVYYLGGSDRSQARARVMAAAYLINGAETSWAKPDSDSRHGRLAWIRDTHVPAHIVECGFMQDDLSDEADEMYATAVAAGIAALL